MSIEEAIRTSFALNLEFHLLPHLASVENWCKFCVFKRKIIEHVIQEIWNSSIIP